MTEQLTNAAERAAQSFKDEIVAKTATGYGRERTLRAQAYRGASDGRGDERDRPASRCG